MQTKATRKTKRPKGLKSKLTDRSAHLGVIGLGYVGLPLACAFAQAGFRVTGIDNDPRKVEALARGESYVQDIPTSVLRKLVKSGKLTATTEFDVLSTMDSVNICVPTPLRKTKDPDVSYIISAVEEIVRFLHTQQLIILESTTYPGTTEELILTQLEQTGLKVGEDFFLAFSPERVDPGNPKYQTKNIPKVVGGVTPKCTEMAATLYGHALETVVPVSSTKVAEMVKLLENTFRSVNIGLVNEMALMSDRLGVNVWEVIEAAATKPFGFMPFFPGPGLGGHCIPIDPFYLSWKAKTVGFEARFIELAGHVNSSMPYYVITKVVDALNDHKKSLNGSKVLVLGVGYKRDIDDVRESPALDIIGLLMGKGAEVHYSDPYVPTLRLDNRVIESRGLTRKAIREYDCVVITADHSSFDYDMIAKASKLIVDTRNALREYKSDRIYRI